MNWLRTAVGLAQRPYTCLTVNKYIKQAACGVTNSFHTSTSRHNKKKTFSDVASDIYTEIEEPKERKIQEKETIYPVHKSVAIEDENRKFGVYFPTRGLLEQTYDGVKFHDIPTVYFICTRNNTKAGAYSRRSQAITVQTGGKVGFKHSKQKTNVCGQTVGFAIGLDLVKKGHQHAKVILKGFGAGRLPSLKGLQLAGINIVTITDRSYPDVSHRPPAARR